MFNDTYKNMQNSGKKQTSVTASIKKERPSLPVRSLLLELSKTEWFTTRENENSLIINKLIATLRKIGAKKSIAIDRQIFPLFPDLIDIVTHLIVIYLFHFCTSLP